MKFKPKRHILIPVVILIYTVVIIIYAGNRYYTLENKGSYIFVIAVNVSLAVILYFILKKRETWRNNQKK